MKVNRKPYSRLSAIFILAIMIPGLILAYSSIQNLSNTRELTEKRVLDEEKAILDSIHDEFDSSLLKLSEYFTDNYRSLEKSEEDIAQQNTSRTEIRLQIRCDKNGKFLYPLFIDAIHLPGKTDQSSSFRQLIIRAETEEFRSRNYASADHLYGLSLKSAVTDIDSAQSLNARARLAVKRKDTVLAYRCYSSLIRKSSHLKDPNGFPYTNFAIPKLLLLSDLTQIKQSSELSKQFLLGILDGEIPINLSTKEVINEVNSWITTHTSFIEEPDSLIYLVDQVKELLAFVIANKDDIRNFILTNNKSGSKQINGYSALNDFDDDEQGLLLIKELPDQEEYIGFVPEIRVIKKRAVLALEKVQTEFTYGAEIENRSFNTLPDETQIRKVSLLSSYTPDEYIVVSLKNENLISEIVTRRSWMYGIALILLIGGLLLGVLLILRDIRRERMISNLRSDFISNVTHELKTPLTSVQMFAESILMDRVEKKSEQKEFLKIIISETKRLKRLINTVLTFSKTEKGKMELHFSEISLSELVMSSIRDMDYWIEERNFKVSTEIQSGIIISADSDALKQALLNILSNSIKFSNDTRELNIRLLTRDTYIYLEIGDRGIGIPGDKIDRIFEKYYRIDSPKVIDSSGTGIGLTVTKNIIEAHDGRIWVESESGRGTKVTIQLNQDPDGVK